MNASSYIERTASIFVLCPNVEIMNASRNYYISQGEFVVRNTSSNADDENELRVQIIDYIMSKSL